MLKNKLIIYSIRCFLFSNLLNLLQRNKKLCFLVVPPTLYPYTPTTDDDDDDDLQKLDIGSQWITLDKSNHKTVLVPMAKTKAENTAESLNNQNFFSTETLCLKKISCYSFDKKKAENRITSLLSSPLSINRANDFLLVYLRFQCVCVCLCECV
jgi:hypothetical protein